MTNSALRASASTCSASPASSPSCQPFLVRFLAVPVLLALVLLVPVLLVAEPSRIFRVVSEPEGYFAPWFPALWFPALWFRALSEPSCQRLFPPVFPGSVIVLFPIACGALP